MQSYPSQSLLTLYCWAASRMGATGWALCTRDSRHIGIWPVSQKSFRASPCFSHLLPPASLAACLFSFLAISTTFLSCRLGRRVLWEQICLHWGQKTSVLAFSQHWVMQAWQKLCPQSISITGSMKKSRQIEQVVSSWRFSAEFSVAMDLKGE